jgi:glycosyltransferase involved in cell wall biosynthesis
VVLSVVICTYTRRRWSLLAEGAAAVQRQLRPGDELVVVVDHEPELAAVAAGHLPGARVLANAHPRGLSGARNTGIGEAGGDVVVFLDDDAVPGDGWLQAYRDRFADPSVGAVGGAVVPRWQGGRAPRWFPEELGWVVGCDYRGLPAHGEPIRNPIGANMAVRRSVLERVGGFTEALGRVGVKPVGCEETDLCIRVRQADPGVRLLRDVRGPARHWVPAERQTVRYLLSRCWFEGRSKARLARRVGAGDGLSSERAYLLQVVLPGVLHGPARGVARGDVAAAARSAVLAAGTLATALGYLTGRLVRRGGPGSVTPSGSPRPVTVTQRHRSGGSRRS